MGKSVTMCVQHASRLIPILLNWTAGVPTIVQGSQHISVADTGTGIVTVTFSNAFARKPIIVAVAEAATGDKVTCTLRSVSASSFILEAISEAGAAADLTTDVHIQVLGFDSADEG